MESIKTPGSATDVLPNGQDPVHAIWKSKKWRDSTADLSTYTNKLRQHDSGKRTGIPSLLAARLVFATTEESRVAASSLSVTWNVVTGTFVSSTIATEIVSTSEARLRLQDALVATTMMRTARGQHCARKAADLPARSQAVIVATRLDDVKRHFRLGFCAEIGGVDEQGHEWRLHRLPPGDGKLIFVRQMFQGRTAADVLCRRAALDRVVPAGAFRADTVAKHASGRASVKSVSVDLKPEEIRTRPLELFP